MGRIIQEEDEANSTLNFYLLGFHKAEDMAAFPDAFAAPEGTTYHILTCETRSILLLSKILFVRSLLLQHLGMEDPNLWTAWAFSRRAS